MKRVIITALVTATLVGGGGAVAASLITSQQIADHTIRARDIHSNAVNSRVVADGSLRLTDLSPTTRAGLKGDPGADGTDGVDGEDGEDATALWAVVTDGAFHPAGDPVDEFHGSGIVSVTRSGSDSAVNVSYDLTFNQDIESCAVLATLIGSGSGAPSLMIRASAVGGAVARVRPSTTAAPRAGASQWPSSVRTSEREHRVAMTSLSAFAS